MLTQKVFKAFDWAPSAQICVQAITWEIKMLFYELLWIKPNRHNVP